MFFGFCLVLFSVRKVLLCLILFWLMVISLGNLWIMEIWVLCLCVKICVVSYMSVMWYLWWENVVFLFIVIVRCSVCGCWLKIINICCNCFILLVFIVF